MTILKKFKSITVFLLAFGFLSASVMSCGGKKEEAATEEAATEHPAEAEHPTEGGEHPAADSTAADTTSAN
jgi:hypothetical protein